MIKDLSEYFEERENSAEYCHQKRSALFEVWLSGLSGGRCAAACSYGAILKLERPCIKACKTKAISIDPDTQKALAEKIREAASKCAGRPIRVEMEEMDTREQINQRSINELARFGNVTIK